MGWKFRINSACQRPDEKCVCGSDPAHCKAETMSPGPHWCVAPIFNFESELSAVCASGPWCGWNCQQENRKGSWKSDKALVATMETVFIICPIQTAKKGWSTSAHEKGKTYFDNWQGWWQFSGKKNMTCGDVVVLSFLYSKRRECGNPKKGAVAIGFIMQC